MARKGFLLMNDLYKQFTVGIEEEYMICNPKDGTLVDRASFIMNHFKDIMPERFSFELIEAEIESNTSVHYEIREAIKELSFLRSELQELGKNNDFCLIVVRDYSPLSKNILIPYLDLVLKWHHLLQGKENY